MFFVYLGIVLLTFQQCSALEDDYNMYEYEHNNNSNDYYMNELKDNDNSYSTGAIIGVVLGVIVILVIKICLCRRYITYRRTVTLVHIPVIVTDNNPHHAGYNQGIIRQAVASPTQRSIPQQPPPYEPRSEMKS